MVVISFVSFLILFLAVGLLSALRSRGTKTDYYLASRSVSPMLTGLSAVATNNSGYMFIGVIGFTYTVGLSTIWLMVGWIVGDFLASFYIHRKLRSQSETAREVTFAGILARWNGTDYRALRIVAALMTLVFLGAYAAAQLSAGGKALQGLFGWDKDMGAVLVSAIVAAYCFAGGIRASIWTDAVQSVVMLVAMSGLMVVAVTHVGGITPAIDAMSQIPGYLDWFPPDLLIPGATGVALFALGWLFAGFSVVGQPHIMVRFMALDREDNLNRARVWYYGFFTIFYGLATGVGLFSRLLLPELGDLDPELALPVIARDLLPPIAVGVVLAGIFAATMSTADSLILSCSSALTHDLLPKRLEKPHELKFVTILVTGFALLIALSDNQSVFSLVILAWSVLGATFGPLLLIYALGGRIAERQAILMMGVALVTVLAWRQMGWQGSVYEGMPAIIASLAVYGIDRLLTGSVPVERPEAGEEPVKSTSR